MNEARTPDSPLLVQGMQTRAQRRERIATAALAGLMANGEVVRVMAKKAKGVEAEMVGRLAELATATADALMAELDRP